MDKKLTKYLTKVQQGLSCWTPPSGGAGEELKAKLEYLEQLVRLQAAVIDALKPIANRDCPTTAEFEDSDTAQKALQAFIAEKLK